MDDIWDLYPFPHWKPGIRRHPFYYPGYYYPELYLVDPATPSFFIFTEDVSPALDAELLDAPDGGDLRLAEMKLEGKPTRFRASGVHAGDFIRAMDAFEELGDDPLSDPQRKRRFANLSTYFEAEPVHRFDFYVGEHDPEARTIGATLLPASWMLIVLDIAPAAIPRPVVHSPEHLGRFGAPRTSWLRWIAPIGPRLELRLRDIFSLKHVGDAGEGDLGGTPPPPDDRPDGKIGFNPAGWEEWTSGAGALGQP